MSLPSAMIGMWLLVSVFVALHGLGNGTVNKGSRTFVPLCRVLLKSLSLRRRHSHFDLNIFFHIFLMRFLLGIGCFFYHIHVFFSLKQTYMVVYMFVQDVH